MALITPAKQEIDFCLRTTKPFHNRKAAQDFFRLVDAYGPNYRPFKYGNYEPMKQIFNDKKEDEIILSWFEGADLSQEELESRPCNAQLIMKGRPPGKIGYYIGWSNWANSVLFNMISVNISKLFLKKDAQNMAQFVDFCNDLVRLFSPVHAEVYDYTSSIPCTNTNSAFIPDRLDIRCPALKWRTYFGPPYIKMLGRDTILNAPCWKTEELGNSIVLQLTETVYEDISPVLRQKVVNYFEESIDSQLRAELGAGFIFRPFDASQSYSKTKKLVPEFQIQELLGKNLDEATVIEAGKPHLSNEGKRKK